MNVMSATEWLQKPVDIRVTQTARGKEYSVDTTRSSEIDRIKRAVDRITAWHSIPETQRAQWILEGAEQYDMYTVSCETLEIYNLTYP